jgi:hypothetical protein
MQPDESPALFAACFHADFLRDLFYDAEDGGEVFLRIVG